MSKFAIIATISIQLAVLGLILLRNRRDRSPYGESSRPNRTFRRACLAIGVFGFLALAVASFIAANSIPESASFVAKAANSGSSISDSDKPIEIARVLVAMRFGDEVYPIAYADQILPSNGSDMELDLGTRLPLKLKLSFLAGGKSRWQINEFYRRSDGFGDAETQSSHQAVPNAWSSMSYDVPMDKPLWSLLPCRKVQCRLAISTMVSTVPVGQEASDVPLGEFLASAPLPTDPRSLAISGAFLTTRPGSLQLFECLGFGWMLMLAAAAIFSQAFRYRSLAFAGGLFVAILGLAALDRITLRCNLSHALDGHRTVADRAIAMLRSSQTFFYHETMRRNIDEMLKDDAQPAALLQLGRTIY